MNAPHEPADDRRHFNEDIKTLNLSPLWESLHNLVPKQPKSPCLPALWKYRDVKPSLMRAGELITAEEAVRRVLVFENPGLLGQSSITHTLYAGLQLILPGEIAPSHRHVQSALRFIVDGKGAYTTVNGERTTMYPGDFIITPSWTWHDHGNEGIEGQAEPVIWLDGLDIPILRFFDAGFAENDTEASQRVSRPEGTSAAEFGFNMAPVKNVGAMASSPIFNYPYERSREALATLAKTQPLDTWQGYKLRYINPLTGGAPMPTMAPFLQLLPAGFQGKPHRSTDGTVYSVVEGSGTVFIGDSEFRFEPQDTFVVPSWNALRISADAASDVVLFSFSDRPMQQAASMLREEFLDA
jgi:gentisate 1,2-dioxygenase